MGDFGYPRGGNLITGGGAVTATTLGTTVTSGAANTKGAWVAVGTPAHACEGFWLDLALLAVGQSLIDVGIGGTGNAVDTTVLGNLMLAGPAARGDRIYIPLKLAPNVRVCVRHQNKAATQTLYALIRFGGANWTLPHGFDVADTWGSTTASTSGTAIDPGAVAHTKGAWVEIAAGGKGLGRRASMAQFAFSLNDNSAPTAANWLIDVGVGGTVYIPNLFLRTAATRGTAAPVFTDPMLMNLPIGADLELRAQCSITDATDRIIHAVCYVYS